MASGYEKTIWNFLKEKIGNDYGVAGMMGNLQAESGLYPDRVQGDIPYSAYSQQYTAQVDSGTISEYDFVHNGPNGGGYGLAQWTFYTRKQGLYNMKVSGGYSSIGDITLALNYLWHELSNDFTGVLNVLKKATSVREASDKVLIDFESPADQSESVKETRASLGQSFYDTFHTSSGNDIIIQKAVDWAVSIANDDSHGYDQENRWGADYDCSSLVIQAYENAGCPVKTNGATYTGNMIEAFVKSGFEKLGYTSGMELLKGDVLWRKGHTAMFIGNGQIVSARNNEIGGIVGGETGDQTGHEIDVSDFLKFGNWTYVLRLPSTGGGEIIEPIIPSFKHNKNTYKFILFGKKRVV